METKKRKVKRRSEIVSFDKGKNTHKVKLIINYKKVFHFYFYILCMLDQDMSC